MALPPVQPPAGGVYRGAIDRLIRGDTLTSVARWVLAQPDRGSMQNVGRWGMEKYLSALAKEVNKTRRTGLAEPRLSTPTCARHRSREPESGAMSTRLPLDPD
jgi:hypothetical protein